MALEKKKSLWVATESTFGTDPSASGAGYLQVYARNLSLIADGREPLDTDYQTGRNYPTAPILGPDGASFDFEVPLIGMAIAAGDGTNASTVTDDWLDRLLLHIFGTQATTPGEGVGVGSTTSNLVLDTDAYGLMNLVPIFEANLPSAIAQRSQLAYITVDPGTGSYTVSPLFAAAPTTAAIGYGQKRYLVADDGGATLAFHYIEDELAYTLTGCRIKAANLNISARKICTMKCTVEADAVATGAKGSLPALSAAPAITPLRGLLSPFYYNGVQYSTPSIDIDLGITSMALEATDGVNGRGGNVNNMLIPKVTVNPLRTDAIRELKRQASSGRMVIQIGAGNFAGGVMNLMSFAMEGASVRKADSSSDSGRLRNAVEFTVADAVALSGTSAVAVQLNRS